MNGPLQHGKEELSDLAAYIAGLDRHVDIIIPFQLDEKSQRAWVAGYHKAMNDVLDRVMKRLNER